MFKGAAGALSLFVKFAYSAPHGFVQLKASLHRRSPFFVLFRCWGVPERPSAPGATAASVMTCQITGVKSRAERIARRVHTTRNPESQRIRVQHFI